MFNKDPAPGHSKGQGEWDSLYRDYPSSITRAKKGEVMDINRKIKKVLNQSFLKEYIDKGVQVIRYQDGSLYYKVNGRKQKSKKHVSEDDIIQLAKKISRLYGRDFSEQNPVVTVKDNGLMFAAINRPPSENLVFYLEIGAANHL